MRALITTISAYGHLQPLLPLAQALVHAGHEVAIATGPDMCLRAGAAGFTTFSAGMPADVAFGRLADRHPDQEYNRLAPSEILDWYLPHLFGEVLAPLMLDDLEPLVRSWQPDVIMHDTWEFAAPIVAASAGIPSVNQTLGIRFYDRYVAAIADAVAPLWRQRGLTPDPEAGLYRHLCLDTTPPGFQSYDTARHRETIRPLRPVALPPVPGETLPAWIESRRDMPLVYMTLGTNTNGDISMFRSVIEGLSDLDVDVLITIGVGKDPASIGPFASNIHVEGYIPQSLILPHCTAVICHGGAGSTLSALARGLPLLILPQGADQYIIGDLVAAANAGVLLVPADVNPASVRASVLALLNEPDRWVGTRRLRREIASMPGPAEVVPLIEQLVAS